MADVADAPAEKPLQSPPAPDAKRPKGILKRSYHHSLPPTSPPATTAAVLPSTEAPDGHPLTDKERTILNTQVNAGHRRSSSAARPSRRSRTPSTVLDHDVGDGQRLKWDEVNLYLTEQDRTATMKIDEPKTPYAQHYDPSEDPSDDEDMGGGLSLGEPEEAVPANEFDAPRARSTPKVHVDDSEQGSVYEGGSVRDGDDPMAGMSAEEREKHLKFEAMRKKHYEMRNVARLLGHSEEIEDAEGEGDDDGDEEEDDKEPAVPPLPQTS
ncbi:hypothetical protein SCUCBS95973_002987 [Sporothrix curviconia]|uniref:Glc8 protein n=1 Tax=Sporothrix curviconia TaxID=1260050 RepID=A0ABP0BBH1_9PEZI